MRACSLLWTLVILFGWVGGLTTAQATHMMGAELTYEYAGTPSAPHQYRVTAWLYQDANSRLSPAEFLNVNCSRNGCDPTQPGGFSARLERVRTLTPVPPVCPGSGARLEYLTTMLQGLVQLPPARWTLSFDGENRVPGVSNYPNSVVKSILVSAELDNSSGLVNSSPQFTSHYLFQLTDSPAQRLSLAAFDPEGDSLVYRLVVPLAAPASAGACAAPAEASVAPHFQLDAATGELLQQPIPARQGLFILAVRVDEYRRIAGTWQLIGRIARDGLYLALASANRPPVFTRLASADSPGGQLLDQTIRVSPGQTISLMLTATDPDAGQQVQLVSEVAGLVPGAAFEFLGNRQGRLTWQVPATLAPGRYAFTAALAFDDACPTRGTQALTISFLVTRPALAVRARRPLTQLPYPAPFGEEVRFQFSEPGRQVVLIMDELGRTVARLTTAPDGSASWRPAPTLPAGLYLARNLRGTQVARLPYAGR